jgi:hypothetical protein
MAASAQGGGGKGTLPNFLKVPGPAGQVKWDASVHIGYEGRLRIRILPPWAAGKPVWHEVKSYFYRSPQNPKGKVLVYMGEDSLFQHALHLALQNPDQRLQTIAQQFGRVRRQFLYNVADVGNPQTHYGQDGIMKPFVLAAGPQLQADIARLANARGGISKLVHVEQGRDLILSKKKTGNEERNVEWGMLDMDPAPFTQQLWPLLQTLWDLESVNKLPTQDEVIAAIRELGLPMPATGPSFGQVPGGYPGGAYPGGGYQPNPGAPWPNPMQTAPAPAPGFPQGPAPYQGGPAPAPGFPQGPAPYQGGPAPYQGGPGMPPVPPNPAPSLPPQSWGGQAMPPAPPPVSTQPGAGYQGPLMPAMPNQPPPMPTPPMVSSQPAPGGAPAYPMNPGQGHGTPF